MEAHYDAKTLFSPNKTQLYSICNSLLLPSSNVFSLLLLQAPASLLSRTEQHVQVNAPSLQTSTEPLPADVLIP